MSREQFWFFHSLRVRTSEVDAQGVIFNAHCLTYFDATITDYFHAFGYDQFASAKQGGVDFYVVKSVVKCNEPIFFDHELEVSARVARIGNSSVEVFLKGRDEVLATGEVVWVSIDKTTHRPVWVAAALRDMISAREAYVSQAES
jgi:acyl-CoA thioester hydrolase